MTSGHKRKLGEIDSGTLSAASPAVVKVETVPLSLVKVEEADRLALALVPLAEPNKRQRGDEASGSAAAGIGTTSKISLLRLIKNFVVLINVYFWKLTFESCGIKLPYILWERVPADVLFGILTLLKICGNKI
jgi:hypothetical protein